MVGTIIPRNQVQKIPTTSLNGTMTDATPVYTCPTGKKALVTYTVFLINYGASAIVNLVVGGTNIEQWAVADSPATGINVYNQRTRTVQLSAGQDIHGHGNVADNATINYNMQIQETGT